MGSAETSGRRLPVAVKVHDVDDVDDVDDGASADPI